MHVSQETIRISMKTITNAPGEKKHVHNNKHQKYR